jgi:hypothetical protein
MKTLFIATLFAATLFAAPRVAATLGAAAPADAQPDDFQWSGTVGVGQTVEIRGVNGRVRALPSDDGRVRVEATRTARRSDPGSVRMEVVEHAGGVTVCAVYPTPRGTRRQNDCRPGGGRSSVRNNDVNVEFVVRVPEGVRFSGHTVNGRVRVEGLRGDADVSTVNGNVSVQTTALAQAKTVNGSVTVRMGGDRIADGSTFSTVNGSVTVELPAGLDAELRARTVNGSIDSDFPVTVSSRVGRRSLDGTIGGGGPALRVSTVNGSIRLRRV